MRTTSRFLPVFIAVVCISACAQDISWTAVDTLIETSYPGVTQITTDSLAQVLGSADGPAPILLDVRTPEEYAVSHLRGAIRIDPWKEDLTPLDTLRGSGPVVTYCSVGYRSAALAERLEQAGFSDVSNLRGSIFQWANEGRPVYRNGARVTKVHPYDDLWGSLLDPALRSRTD